MNEATAGTGIQGTGQVKKEADREHIGAGERAGNLVGIVLIMIFAALIYYIQGRGYIFSPEFTAVDSVLFYGTLLFGIIPNLVRMITARRNLGRLFDIISSLLFLVVGSYFLVKFPFDIDDLYLILPDAIQDSFRWFNDAVFRFLLQVALIVTAIGAVYNGVMYVLVRRELRRRESGLGR